MVAAAIAMLTATTVQFGAIPSANAHGGGFGVHGHRIKAPPPVKAPPVDNVRDFGATGNGVTDDTTAIQNTANDAASKGKGVFFPAGTYLHASPVTFNGVPVTGVGLGSVLIANNPGNCAVILTGFGPSIQNMVISTQGLAGGTSLLVPNTATILVQNATSFTVANDTIVAGPNAWPVLVLMSTVGTINSVVCDGTGNVNDIGVVIDQSNHVTIANCLFQNEASGVAVLPNGGPSQSIAVLSNTVGNVTWPTTNIGIFAASVSILDISQNTIQMANSNVSIPIEVTDCNNFTVAANDTWGGLIGAEVFTPGSGNNFVTQNTMHNCGSEGIEVTTLASSAIHVTSNAFGECGLLVPSPVILVIIAGPGAEASAATTFIQNNSYQGHLNLLNFLIVCGFGSAKIPPANVTGNTQTQTALSNFL
jgi:hypothetical protein